MLTINLRSPALDRVTLPADDLRLNSFRSVHAHLQARTFNPYAAIDLAVVFVRYDRELSIGRKMIEKIEIVAALPIQFIQNDPVFRPDEHQSPAMCESSEVDSTIDEIDVGKSNVLPDARRCIRLPAKCCSRLGLAATVNHHCIVRSRRTEEITPCGRAVVNRSSGIDQEFVAAGEERKRQRVGMSVTAAARTHAAAVKDDVSIFCTPTGTL